MTQGTSKDKWQSIQNIDLMKRKPNEWAKIYNMQLIENIPDQLWNEYEWSFNLQNLKYWLLPDKNGEFDKAAEMEMRAQELRRDLFVNADPGERYVLENKKYIETEWCRRKLSFMI